MRILGPARDTIRRHGGSRDVVLLSNALPTTPTRNYGDARRAVQGSTLRDDALSASGTNLAQPPRGAPMTVTDELIENAKQYAVGFDKGDLPMPPAKKIAVVACMDARLNVY